MTSRTESPLVLACLGLDTEADHRLWTQVRVGAAVVAGPNIAGLPTFRFWVSRWGNFSQREGRLRGIRATRRADGILSALQRIRVLFGAFLPARQSWCQRTLVAEAGRRRDCASREMDDLSHDA
jgi:hypothetical protein